MSQGILYGDAKYADRRIRTVVAVAIIKKFNLDVKVVNPDDDKTRFRRYFPTGKLPGFIGPNGLKLTEAIAVCVYLLQLAPGHDLLGRNLEEKAQILMWLSFTNCEVLTTIASAFKPLIGQLPYNKAQVERSLKYLEEVNGVLESRLTENTYLVGSRATFADYFSAGLLVRGFNYLYGTQWRQQHPAITEWFTRMINEPFLKDVFGEVELIDVPVQDQSRQ